MKFFHNKVVWRARKNKVKYLVDEAGIRHEEQVVMASMVTNYFLNLFCDDALQPEPILNILEANVTTDMNDKFRAYFSDKEFSDSVFQIDPIKSLKKDDIPTHFFHRNWLVMKEELIAAVKVYFPNMCHTAGGE